MSNDFKKTISSFDSLILVKVKEENDNIFQSTFTYELGSFNIVGFKDFANFNQLISCIYRSAAICEGIGYYEYRNQIKESIYYCLKEGRGVSFILPLRKKGKKGKTYYFLANLNKSGDTINVLFVCFDNKSELYSFEEFSSGTFKDSLTGLFNYRTLVSHIKDNRRKGYLCLYDLNKFKCVNDTFGHETGDDVLQLVAKYLISIASMNEVFYRRSGDEFVILVFEKNMKYVLNLINKIESYLETVPGQLNKDFVCSAAFGILELKEVKENETPLDYETQSKLIDLAMYQAKRANKLYHFISYNDAMDILKKGDIDERIDAIATK